MKESNNLKNYKLGILKSKENDERIIDGITIIIAIVGCINISIWIKIVFIALLGIFYLFTKHRINAIVADNKFLDEDIIQFRELAHELETVRINNQNNNKKLQQVTSIIVTLHRTINNLEKCLTKNNPDYKTVKTALSNTIRQIFEVLTEFYADYQEHITIALYIFCAHTNEYLDFISYKPEIMNKGKGRIWPIDDNSHICQAVRQVKLSSEIRDFVYDNINQELPRVLNIAENDEAEYVSSISIPILYDGRDVNAVLSVTSNYPNRFRNLRSEDFQEIKINKIFVDLFYAIAQILEITMKNNFQVLSSNIIKDTLIEYQKEQRKPLTEEHLNLINEVQH